MKRILLLLTGFVCLKAFPQCASQTVLQDSIFKNNVLETNGSCLSQQFNMPLVAGIEYTITIVLTGNISCSNLCSCYGQCQVYGGFSSCDESGQLLWSSTGYAIPSGLNTYTFTFHPSQNFTYLSLVNYFNPSWQPACPGPITVDSIALSSAAKPLIVTMQLNHNSCTIDSNGMATIHATGYSPFAYQWSNGQSDSILQNVPAGKYEVRVKDSVGCFAYDTVAIGSQTPPNATIGILGDTLKSLSASSYQWYLNGYSIKGATNQSYIPQQNGNYDVITVDSTGCTSNPSNTIYIGDISGIYELTTANFRIYPNPVTNSVTIYSENTPISLSLSDLTGRVILSKKISGKINDLDVSQISKGTYLIKIQEENKYFYQKLIIQ